MATILIALGANLGDRGDTLDEAIDQLAADPSLTLLKRSQLLVTKPVGGPSGQPDFLNAAAKFETPLSPTDVHQKLIEVEQRHGRVRVERWGARSLDLDLLLYDSQIIDSPQLTVPHPRMSFRRFVMQPAAEVASEMAHPELGTTIGQLWRQLNETPPVVQVATLPGPTAWRFCREVQQNFPAGQIVVPEAPSAWPDSVDQFSVSLVLPDDVSAEPPAPRNDSRKTLVPCWSSKSLTMQDTLPPTSLSSSTARLVVYWMPADELVDEIEQTWWPGRQRQQLANRLAEAVRQEVHGPRLWLGACDWTAAVTEVSAAIEAMG